MSFVKSTTNRIELSDRECLEPQRPEYNLQLFQDFNEMDINLQQVLNNSSGCEKTHIVRPEDESLFSVTSLSLVVKPLYYFTDFVNKIRGNNPNIVTTVHNQDIK